MLEVEKMWISMDLCGFQKDQNQMKKDDSVK